MGADRPKQYLPLLGRPLIAHTLSRLLAEPLIQRVFVVLSPDDGWWAGEMLGEASINRDPRVRVLACGGATRADSVTNGLAAMAGEVTDEDWVLVHDAARPCLSARSLHALVASLADDPVGGILALPVADTVKLDDGKERIARTVPREGLWQAQTPQMFRHRRLREALAQARGVTDEASAMEASGLRPRLVRGEPTNLKVTYAADLALAGLILRAQQSEEGLP